MRSGFDDDFTEGGHDYVYEFVPQNEVWIDNDLEELERPYVLLHELHERNLMAKGWTYSKAHEDSSKLEYHFRHHPNELHDALAAERLGIAILRMAAACVNDRMPPARSSADEHPKHTQEKSQKQLDNEYSASIFVVK